MKWFKFISHASNFFKGWFNRSSYLQFEKGLNQTNTQLRTKAPLEWVKQIGLSTFIQIRYVHSFASVLSLLDDHGRDEAVCYALSLDSAFCLRCCLLPRLVNRLYTKLGLLLQVEIHFKKRSFNSNVMKNQANHAVTAKSHCSSKRI